MAVGRISGPLLKANLLRQGVDLAFETDLVYLKVTDLDSANHRVGIKTNDPSHTLHVAGTTRTTNLIVDTLAEIADVSISGTDISTTQDTLTLTPSGVSPVVYQAKLRVDDIDVQNNVISTNSTNTNLELRPNGTGSVNVFSDVTVNGSIHATGDITADGNIQLGDANTDNITFAADIASNIIPDVDNTYTLGTAGTIFALGVDYTGTSPDDVSITIASGVGTLSIGPSGTAWRDALTATAVDDILILVLDTVVGSFDATITVGWSGTNPQTATVSIPGVDDGTYAVTSVRFGQKRWADVWTNTLFANTIDTGDLVVDNINLNLRQGNIWYVAANGSDAYSGTHQNDPFATVKYALSQAVSGDTVFVYPGVYTEQFPLTVPVGVNLKGAGIRAVKIVPATGTEYNDAVLLNGESTVEDLTIADFFSGGNYYEVLSSSAGSTTVNVGVAPFAHTYVSGGTITIGLTDYAVTGATYDYLTGDVTITHDNGVTASLGSNIFLTGLTFSCNGGNRTFPDNGYAFRFAADYQVTTRSPYIRNITVLTKGSVTSVSDPLGFDAGDAGKGAYIDGAYAVPTSLEASMLFHSATFICPGVDAITATNGARVEWLNSFTYYANRGFYAYSSNDGIAGQGRTQLRLSGSTGTFAATNTLTYYDTDGTTVLASGTIDSVDVDGKIYLTGKVEGFETAAERGGKTIAANGDAQLSTAVKKFGTASLALDGTGDYANIAATNDFGFGTDDFTVETWIYLTDLVGTQQVFDFRAGAVGDVAPTVYVSNGGQIRYYTDSADRITGSTLNSATWYHIALVRASGSTILYVNGTQVGATYSDSNNYGVSKPLTIGSRYDGGNEFGGYFDDMRVVKGVAITPQLGGPTTRVLVTPETVLMARFDGDNASTVFEDDVVYAQDIRSSAGGTATGITLADYTDFGAEIRSIASAAVYGNYGFYGDGLGVVAYLIGQNLAYIGVGKRSDNDNTYVIQTNEIIELNGAKIYYSSVDHKGDFRVGDLFYINQAAGTVNFTSSSFNINSTSGVTITDGVNTTYIDGTRIDTGNLRLSGNTLESLSGDVNIVAASDNINLQNNVNIAGNLDVVGDVTIGGNITLGDQNTDTINFVAGIASDIVPRTTETYSLGTNSLVWSNLWTGWLHVDDIDVNNNTISVTTADTDLVLSANGTGVISIPTNNVSITNNLTVSGTTNLADTNITGTLTHIGDVTQTGNVDITGDVDITGNLTVGDYAQFTDVRIENNVVSTTLTNSDLTLTANGTGRIYVPNNDVQFDQNLTVVGTISTATLNNTGTITSDEFFTGDILISGNTVETTLTDSDLNLSANGAGVIKIEEFDFSTNVISSNSNNDIVLQPGTNKTVVIDSNQSIVIPVGTTLERPATPAAGMIRFNTVLSRYEGYDGSDWIRLDSRVTDLDENTTITAELTPGANDNIIRFYNDGNLTATLDSTKLTVPRIEVDNIIIDGDTISSSATDTDLNFVANGTGSVVLENFAFKDNTITNTVSGSITTISQTGSGYFKIQGTNGFVVPTGISSERPAYAVVGMTRYNSEVKQLEVFNGISWDSAAGAGGGINAATAEDIAITYALILG